MFLVIFLLLIVAAALILVFLEYKYTYFKRRNIPFSKPSYLVGNLDGIGWKYQLADKFRNIYEEFKTRDVICGFYMLFQPVVLAIDPELVHRIIIKDFNCFTDRGVFHNEKNEMLTRNLFSISGRKWKNLRNKLSPAFTTSKLKFMFDVIQEKSDRLVDAIVERSGSSSIEMKKLAIRFTIDSLMACACDLDCNTLLGHNEDVVKISEMIFGSRGLRQLYIFFIFAFPEAAKKFKMKQFGDQIENYFKSVIKESIRHRGKISKNEKKDVLDILLQLQRDEKLNNEASPEQIEFEDIVAQVFIIFFAGVADKI